MHWSSILSKQAKKIIVTLALVVFSVFLSLYSRVSFASKSNTALVSINADSTQQKPWQLWRSNEALKVSYRASEYDDLIEIKAQAQLASSLGGFIHFIEDLSNIAHWLDNAESAEIISQISNNENIFITRFKGLWPVSARDMVVHSRYWQNPDLSLEIAVTDAGETIKKTNKAIRMQVLKAHWTIVPTALGQIDISYQFIVDPAGNIPQWLTKTMTLRSIWSTLDNLSTQLPESKWQQQHRPGIKELQIQ
jgi:hypothetical protein